MATGTACPENDLTAQSLTDIFNDSIARYRAAFPAKLGNLLITRGDERFYVAPELATLLKKKAKAVNNIIEQRRHDMKYAAGMAGQEFISTFSQQHILNYISLSNTTDTLFVSAQYPAAMNRIAMFDHEMGYLISEKGWVLTNGQYPQYYTKTRHEEVCTADAYAVLRHPQRFGGDTDIFENLAGRKAETLVSTARPPITRAQWCKKSADSKRKACLYSIALPAGNGAAGRKRCDGLHV